MSANYSICIGTIGSGLWRSADSGDSWKRVANEMISESGVDVRLHSWFSRAIVSGGRITGVICETKAGRQAIMGDVVIDTSGRTVDQSVTEAVAALQRY